jgi:hypothetical protein
MRGELTFELHDLLLETRHAGRERNAIRIIGLGGGGIADQGVPLLPGFTNVKCRLAKESEGDENQPRRSGRGGHGETHVVSLAVWRWRTNALRTGRAQ